MQEALYLAVQPAMPFLPHSPPPAAAAAAAAADRCNQPCYLLVGPEGDFTPEEVAALTAAGALPVGLGANRLRTETAALALLSTAAMYAEAQLQT
jgi:16S rRNA (uracil1498-N3)-methyltransferase